MKSRPASIAAILISGFLGLTDARAQLPALEEQPWMGYFAVFGNKRFNIGVTSQGQIKLSPMNEKGQQVTQQLDIAITAGIEEILPDGRAVMKQLNPETLTSEQPATAKLEKTTIRGKVTGDAEFELNIEQSRGIIFIGGRVLDPGKLTKNPLRFAVRARIPNGYPHEKNKPSATEGDDDSKQDREAKKAEKAFMKKIEDDSLEVKWTDGKRVKRDFVEPVEAASKDLCGPGITSAEVEISSYKGKRFVFTASPNSSITLWNEKPAPLYTGFTINWSADPAKDADGKARLAVEVR